MRKTPTRALATIAATMTLTTAALLCAAPGHTAARGHAAAPGRAAALPDLASRVDTAVAGYLGHDRIPGAAVTVVSGGRTVLTKGYGVADVRTRTPVDPRRTGFFLGSLAKLFTAQAASQLVATGTVNPRADVNDYLRTVTVPDTYPGRPVTLDHLLTHTAGFDSDLVGRNKATAEDVEPLAESLVTRRPPRLRAPGTTVAYDNYGYALAGQLVADVSGRPFPAYVDAHILKPLGMDRSTFAQPQPARIAADLARGYRPTGAAGWTEDKGQYGAWSPSGPGAVTTAADMGRWMADQLTGGSAAARLMQRTHYRQDTRLPGLGYGFEEWRRGARTGWYKDGDIPGFHSGVLLLPGRDLGVFVVFNGDGTGGRANWDGKDLINRIVDAMAPDGRGAAHPPHDVADSAVASYTGSYRAARVSRTGLMAVEGLVGAVTVERDGANGLRTTGLSLDPDRPEQRWAALGGGLFRERDGDGGGATIAFDKGGMLVSSVMPSTAYERLTWRQSPSLHMALLGFGTAGLVLGAGAYPVTALVRRFRGRPRYPRAARAARATAAATGLLAAGFTAALASVVADGNAMMETVPLGSPLLSVVTGLGAALVPATLGLLAGAVAAWLRGWWGVAGRVLFTLTAGAAVAMVGMLFQYHLVGGPFAWLTA
ncbi:beta-lactamase family protein [Streptomyces sp. RS10V-4]|uniref:serine hydrolase domain-containing protein n=1 Tax=Streptomyces rhizoryzae TaxID=2932493 RepID=UPI0020045444|nr:serine hydrolase domain-containing protein [Streptomyces rhizoryzae]MCK7625908.1 beta-lactamase family protein [Streptomyces rhizoryzae]